MDVETRAQFDPVRRLPKEHARLCDALRDKPENDWANPTHCPGWTVDQLVAHLVINAEFLAESVRTILDRPPHDGPDLPLPFGFPDLAAFENWRTEETKRLVGSGPEGLTASLETAGAGLQEELGRIDPANAVKPFWHPSGEGKLGYIPTFRFFEMQLHAWDIRAEEDLAAALSDSALGLMTDRLPSMLGRYVRLRSEPGHPAGRIRILVTDPARNFLMDWKGKESGALVDDGGPVEATLTGTGNTWVLLAAGRADREQCEAEGTFHVLGNAEVGRALVEILFAPLKYL